MKPRPLIGYLTHRYKIILVWLVIILGLYWLNPQFIWFNILIFTLAISRDYLLFGEEQQRIRKLKAKGLTEDDLANIDFVKKWEFTRGQGIWLYCLKDGGLIGTFGLSFIFGGLFAFSNPKRFLASPGDMFKLIGICAIAGAVIGVILFRVKWRLNEHRFKRLTDPLNMLFSAKKTSFEDLQ